MARLTWFLALALLLAGCETPGPGGGADGSARGFFAGIAGNPPLPRASLVGGAIVASGPPGYCVDPLSIKTGPGHGFAVIASCQILSRGQSGFTVDPAMITLSVAAASDGQSLPSAQALAQLLNAPLLGQKGDATVTLAHLGSGGDVTLDHGDPRHWRGAFVHNGFLVGLGLYAPDGSPLAGPAGADFLNETVRRIRAGSVPQPQATAAQPAAPRAQSGLGGFWSRLTAP